MQWAHCFGISNKHKAEKNKDLRLMLVGDSLSQDTHGHRILRGHSYLLNKDERKPCWESKRQLPGSDRTDVLNIADAQETVSQCTESESVLS